MTLMAEKFVVTYVASCGDSYDIENCYTPRVPLYCTDCFLVHYYEKEFVTHPLTWDEVMDDEVWEQIQAERFIEEIE